MEASDFFIVAVELARHPSEAFQRSALSRIYYGVHHETAEHLRQAGAYDARSDVRGSRHTLVEQLLTQESVRAGELLRELRRRRNEADYDVGTRWPASRVDEAWERASELRRLLGTQ